MQNLRIIVHHHVGGRERIIQQEVDLLGGKVNGSVRSDDLRRRQGLLPAPQRSL
jgi:hypothetical protein